MSGLYEDLDEKEGKNEIIKLQETIKNYETENKNLKSTISEMTQQIQTLISDRNQIEANIVALYNTAMLEIRRKERDIDDLRNASEAHSGSSNKRYKR